MADETKRKRPLRVYIYVTNKEMEEINVGNQPNSDVSTYFDYSTTPEIVKSEDEYIGLQHRRLQHVNGEGADNYEWDWF